MEVERVSTGSGPLDGLLNGGLEKEVITNVFGESGTGKTNVCVQVAAEIASDGKQVVYIDTEKGFSAERFRQIAGEDAEDSITLFEPLDFEEQEEAIESLDSVFEGKDVGAIVVDSLVSLYRLRANGDNVQDANQRLSQQLSELSRIARDQCVPVLVTNQVYSNFEEEGLELVGRDVPRYWSKCLLKVSQSRNSVRTIEIEKHRSLPEGRSRQFQIVDGGLIEPEEKGLF